MLLVLMTVVACDCVELVELTTEQLCWRQSRCDVWRQDSKKRRKIPEHIFKICKKHGTKTYFLRFFHIEFQPRQATITKNHTRLVKNVQGSLDVKVHANVMFCIDANALKQPARKHGVQPAALLCFSAQLSVRPKPGRNRGSTEGLLTHSYVQR